MGSYNLMEKKKKKKIKILDGRTHGWVIPSKVYYVVQIYELGYKVGLSHGFPHAIPGAYSCPQNLSVHLMFESPNSQPNHVRVL